MSQAADFLEALVRIRSHSSEEAEAASWLAEQMSGSLGFTRAYVDEAGNAVGEMGEGPRVLMLLGHIDTVKGEVPVRRESGLLYGRGTVDAKGPLASFALACSAVGPRPGFKFVVVGAVEEESATSKGARHVARAWNPEACIIGEPSHWSKLCLGYKGRLLVDYRITRPMSHTAGKERGACEHAVDFWNEVVRYADRFNEGRERVFDQLSPSLRQMHSTTDGLVENAELALGLRVPVELGIETLKSDLAPLAVEDAALEFSSEEDAIRAPKNTPLVRAFLGAIREAGGSPGFSVKTGTADMNVVGPVWGCPILAYGPGDSSLDHTPDEHVVIEDLEAAIRVLEHALRELTTS